MRVDRRSFLWISGASALSAMGCTAACNGTSSPGANKVGSAPAPARGTAVVPPGALRVEFTGLGLLEKQANTMIVHLVDGSALMLGPHEPRLKIPLTAVDLAATQKPAAARAVAEGDDQFWVFDLTKVNVTMPSSPSGQPDLTLDESDIGSVEKPASDDGWKSLAWVPDLRALTGATKIVDRNALTSGITLRHGRLEATIPEGSGRFAVWEFKNAGNTLIRRALTNKIVYTWPTAGRATTITVGDQQIVFRPDAGAKLEISNLPPPPPPCPSPCKLNLNHFVAFFSLVDTQFKPTVELASYELPKDVQGDADPQYCPFGRI
jgi:hypothetical protein